MPTVIETSKYQAQHRVRLVRVTTRVETVYREEWE